MPGSLQRLNADCRMFFFHQYVVGIEGGNGKDGDAALSQGIEERGQNSGQREGERSFELEAGPRRFTFCVSRSLIDRADDGEFFGGSRDEMRDAATAIRGTEHPERQTADGEGGGKASKFQRAWDGSPNSAELRSAWTGRRPVPTWSQVVPAALFTAALASRRVESSVGSDEESGVTSSGISVQPRTTASQPWSARVRITS